MQGSEQTVIITGSSGLIGSRVIELAPGNYRIAGFDNHGPPDPPVRAECVPVDLTLDHSVDRGLERVKYAYGLDIASVVHLAAFYDFSGEDSPLYDELTVRGTERLLAGLQDKGFRVGQFVFSSTMLVHAPCEPGEAIDEDWALDPQWPYPKSKVLAEQTIKERRGSIPSVVLRIAGVYDGSCNSLPLAHQMQRIYERKLTGRVFPGDASRGQAFVHIDDVVDAIWRVVERRAELPKDTTLLIGEPVTLSYDDLQAAFGMLIHGQDWETTRIPKALAKTGAWIQDTIPGVEEPFIKPWMIDLADAHYQLNIDRARRLLGWRPRHTLRETLSDMVRALKADPPAFYTRNKLEGAPPTTARDEQPAATA
jgi:nucleoside-diphosphate-sugar epimerase